jgi:hypothetical protein
MEENKVALNELLGLDDKQDKEVSRKIETAGILKDDIKDVITWLKIDKLPEAKRLLILRGCYLFRLIAENELAHAKKQADGSADGKV